MKAIFIRSGEPQDHGNLVVSTDSAYLPARQQNNIAKRARIRRLVLSWMNTNFSRNMSHYMKTGTRLSRRSFAAQTAPAPFSRSKPCARWKRGSQEPSE